MSSNFRDNPATRVSMKALEQHAREGSFHHRQQGEQSGFAPRRWRRKSGRTEFIALRTFPDIKQLIIDMANEQEKHLGEIVEDAVRLLREKTSGQSHS